MAGAGFFSFNAPLALQNTHTDAARLCFSASDICTINARLARSASRFALCRWALFTLERSGFFVKRAGLNASRCGAGFFPSNKFEPNNFQHSAAIQRKNAAVFHGRVGLKNKPLIAAGDKPMFALRRWALFALTQRVFLVCNVPRCLGRFFQTTPMTKTPNGYSDNPLFMAVRCATFRPVFLDE